METVEKETEEKDVQELTVDFSKQTLKKIERANKDQQLASSLILDDNEIQRLDNLDTFSRLVKLSLVNNQLIRMYGVSNLLHLQYLDISNNSLVTIEGLKDLKELKHLILSGNKIKTIEHLNSNLNLEKVDLSGNNITHISDISFLKNLKELNIHENRISHLRHCEKNLPDSIEILTFHGNSVCDLNEISCLAHLSALKKLTFFNNPCVDFADNQKPFIKNWCSSLIILDDSPLDDIECLKAEWLYSQGRGRSFRPGEHAALVEYLTGVCPRKAEQNAETEDVKKLKLILSKAQQHQQQLREQLSTGKFGSLEENKSPSLKKKGSLASERMVTSFQESPLKENRYSPELMTRSLDSNMLRNSPPTKNCQGDLSQTPLQASTTFIPIPDTLISPDVSNPSQNFVRNSTRPSSLSSRASHSSKNSPHSTPESKRKSSAGTLRRVSESSSPNPTKKQGKLINSRSSTPLGRYSNSRISSSPVGREALKDPEKSYKETSEEDEPELLIHRTLPISPKTNQRKQYKKNYYERKKEKREEKEIFKEEIKSIPIELTDTKAWKAAVCIQRRWRGYRARNLNREVLAACKNIQMNRMQDYITKVVSDMEATRVALEGNRKLQVLQMQAINALWKKITTIQPNDAVESSEENKISLQNVLETCSSLNKQVEGLQIMVKAMQTKTSSCPLVPIATQTEITAVHTPQGEGRDYFPYNPKLNPGQSVTNTQDSTHSPSPVDVSSDPTKNSENESTSDTAKTLTEIFTNKNLSGEDCSSPKLNLEENTPFRTTGLTKPSVKLNESLEKVLTVSTAADNSPTDKSESSANATS